MREREAKIVLLVRAFEEVDREGRILSPEQRLAATRRAVTATMGAKPDAAPLEWTDPRQAETVVRRARLLFDGLADRLPSLRRVTELARLRSLTGPAVVATALLLGLAGNALGPERRINLLAAPLLGLLAWNLLTYAVTAVTALLRAALRGRRDAATETTPYAADPHPLAHGLAGWVVRLHRWFGQLGGGQTLTDDPQVAPLVAGALSRWYSSWHGLTAALLETRVRRYLHLGAAAMVAGVVAGMYLRGFAFEYRATWESTLLEADQVQALLGRVLGPAAAVLGATLPDVAPLEAPRDGDAELWIQLYAVTALMFVVLPRTVFALVQTWRAARIEAGLSVDLEDGYYRRILAGWRGGSSRVLVLPYSYNPQGTTLQSLKLLLHDFFGARAEIGVAEAADYGDDAPGLQQFDERENGPAGAEERYLVVLFNLAQSPEAEVHGTFLEELEVAAEPRRIRLLPLVDGSTYLHQVGSPERCAERQRAWDAVLRGAGSRAVHIDPDRAAREPEVALEYANAVREALGSPTATTEDH